MRKFVLEIECENDAFAEERGHEEVARILTDVARMVSNGWNEIKLHDVNGSAVGSAAFVASKFRRNPRS